MALQSKFFDVQCVSHRHRAGVIIGVKWSEFFRTRRKNSPVRKFNPDTGQPYMKDNFEDVYFVGEVEVGNPEDYLKKGGFKNHGNVKELGYWDVGFEREPVIGFMIEDHNVEYDGGIGEYDLQQLNDYCKNVAANFQALGCYATPKIHFFSYCSC